MLVVSSAWCPVLLEEDEEDKGDEDDEEVRHPCFVCAVLVEEFFG